MEEKAVKFGFLDGEFLPWKDCKVHIDTQVVRYGYRTFEGIKAYWNEDRKKGMSSDWTIIWSDSWRQTS